MKIGHNMYSLNLFRNYKQTINENSKCLNNISSGLKINSAKDNPNKIAQSDNLKLQILARDAATSNIQDTNSMFQTFDATLQEMNNSLSRLTQLTVSASTGTNAQEDLEVIQKEIDVIINDLDYLSSNTDFNGVKLSVKNPNAANGTVTDLNNPSTTKQSVIGELSGDKVTIPFYDLSSEGLNVQNIDVTKTNGAEEAMEKISNATNIISNVRVKYGAIQSRLEDTYDSMSEITETITAAQSKIADADIAEEMMDYARTNILYQSAISLMAQSNNFPQDALNILSSVK